MTIIRKVLPLLALTAFALVGEPVLAQTQASLQPQVQDTGSPELRSNQILIEYVPPNSEALQPVFQKLARKRVLEKFQLFLSPFRLPRPLLLQLQECDGDSNAWYENYTVTVCYEYIAELVKNAPKRQTPTGVSHDDAIAGPAIEVFLHEAGHAVFSMLKIPVFGRAEDAADQFAAYLMLTLGREEARRIVGGVAFMYKRDAQEERRQVTRNSRGMQAYADEHGFAAQRLYNLLCVAYGAYPDVFQDIVDNGYLPKARARRCAGEYQQLKYAMMTLIKPHCDLALYEEVQRHRWLDPATALR